MPTSLLFVETWYFTVLLLKDRLDTLLGGTLTETDGWLLFLEGMSTSLFWGMTISSLFVTARSLTMLSNESWFRNNSTANELLNKQWGIMTTGREETLMDITSE